MEGQVAVVAARSNGRGCRLRSRQATCPTACPVSTAPTSGRSRRCLSAGHRSRGREHGRVAPSAVRRRRTRRRAPTKDLSIAPDPGKVGTSFRRRMEVRHFHEREGVAQREPHAVRPREVPGGCAVDSGRAALLILQPGERGPPSIGAERPEPRPRSTPKLDRRARPRQAHELPWRGRRRLACSRAARAPVRLSPRRGRGFTGSRRRVRGDGARSGPCRARQASHCGLEPTTSPSPACMADETLVAFGPLGKSATGPAGLPTLIAVPLGSTGKRTPSSAP